MVETLTLRVCNASRVALNMVVSERWNKHNECGGTVHLMKSCDYTLYNGGKPKKRKREVHEQNVKIQKLCRRSDFKKKAL